MRAAASAWRGPTMVVTDIDVLAPDVDTKALTLVGLAPGATVDSARAARGCQSKTAAHEAPELAPTALEPSTLRAMPPV
jgi:acyl CoA:acetate/3-ketoacid CoA transferase beta subunit